jgi:hypothetical protein
MKKKFIFLILLFSILDAQTIKLNSSIKWINSYKFETPNNNQIKIPADSRFIIISFDKQTNKLINNYLNTKDKGYLQKKKGIFIVDIHTIPTFFVKIFALEKLRDYKHQIYLHYGDSFQKNIPNKDKKITFLALQDGKVSDILFLSTSTQLQKAIESI